MVMEPSNANRSPEIQATLAARRELGPEYDDHFIERLVTQLTQAQQRVPVAPAARQADLSTNQRTAIAICSLIFGIPLIAIAGEVAGGVGLAVAFAALVLINLAAGR